MKTFRYIDMDIKQNIEAIRKRIDDAAARAGRKPDEIKLICVSKTKPSEYISEAYACGERNFGENYVQELVAKHEELPKDIIWHMIGPLQSNKVKKAVSCASLIHAVPSVEIAEKIGKEAVKLGKTQDVLIEINVGAEESKHGITPAELIGTLEKIHGFEGVNVKGLMCIPPYALDPEETRPYFKEMVKLKNEANEAFPEHLLSELSMGMSGDFEAAIEEGATFVRVGTAIFGERNYSK